MTDVRAVYEAVAQEFDRDRSKSLMEKFYLDRVLAHLVDGASVLDIGCGSAEPIAKFLAILDFANPEINILADGFGFQGGLGFA